MASSESLRNLIVARHRAAETPVECKKKRMAATAEMNSARSDVQYYTDAVAREEANETAYSTASQAVSACTEDDELVTKSTTLKTEVEDFRTEGESKAGDAEPHLDTADTAVESYFDDIDDPDSKLKAQILLARMR